MLIGNKKTDAYQDARISYTDVNGNTVEQNIEVKPRGKYRRMICDSPPLMLKFSKEELATADLNDDHKLKLVTHCFEDNIEESEQNLLKEFLVYKILNLLTEKSYRVQLVNITYIDSKDDRRLQRVGFIIESTRELGERLESVSKTLYNLNIEQLEPTQYHTVAMFQYMICNTDWPLRVARNIKTFLPEETDKITIVPYDFDFSGLVNAHYAKINPDFNQTNLRERVFMGKFDNEEQLNETLAVFKERKKDIISLCKNFKLLNKKNRQDVSNFIRSFYKIIGNKKLRISEFLEGNTTALIIENQ
ncbi:MAG: hypothetical protein DHS20C18_20530 [Saprospiraceae bacterium]|nr:MAG: hypothetical protein DHS20C18_20530 [Saprospiraceae bacterium]